MGWRPDRQRGSHLTLVKEGERLTLTVPPHRELDRGTLGRLIRDAGLTVDEFLEALCACQMAPRGARGHEEDPAPGAGEAPEREAFPEERAYMGCHNGIGPEARAYVMDTVDEFVGKNA